MTEHSADEPGCVGRTRRTSTEALSPALRHAVAATETSWAALEAEFGLLSDEEAAAVMSRHRPGLCAADMVGLREAAEVVWTCRGGQFSYPGFQFDTDGQVRGIVPALRRVAQQNGWSQNGLLLWMCAPCGRLDARRPVDCLDQGELVLGAAQAAFGASW